MKRGAFHVFAGERSLLGRLIALPSFLPSCRARLSLEPPA
jgi:hypothetical protein